MKQAWLDKETGISILYALPFLAHAMALTPLITFIPSFYSGKHGLPLQLVGAIIFAARLFDIVVEPTVGILSDRTRGPLGRRKSWILAGLPILMLGCWMVFAPPVKVDALYAGFWITITFVAFNVLDTPYKAWGAELSRTYMGRARVAGWREGFGSLSGLLALILIFIMQQSGSEGLSDTMFAMAVAFVIGMPILFAITLTLVPEPPIEDLHIQPPTLKESFKVIGENKPFMMILGGLGVLMAGGIIGATLHIIVMEKYFDARKLFPIILGSESIAGILSIPLWLWLAKRVGKHRAMAIGVMWMAVWSAPIPLLKPDDDMLYAACIVIRGFGGGALAVLIGAMVADVVDIDTLKTGQARNGLYFAMVGMLGKIGIAFGALVGTTLPTLFGFQTANAVNSPEALFALLVTYAWVPMVIMGLAAPFFWFYPLTEQEQKRLRSEIERKLQTKAEA
ncbi:MAG: MFS transporter [Hyphomonadaceae bacterium]|jgi:GPH family glycoside/pentoside/hexuronide:cation symporter